MSVTPTTGPGTTRGADATFPTSGAVQESQRGFNTQIASAAHAATSLSLSSPLAEANAERMRAGQPLIVTETAPPKPRAVKRNLENAFGDSPDAKTKEKAPTTPERQRSGKLSCNDLKPHPSKFGPGSPGGSGGPSKLGALGGASQISVN